MKIIGRKVEFRTPWFELVSKQVTDEAAPYYALAMPDYVSVVAFTAEAELLLVRQFRPAIESYTLELPSGCVEKNEPPEITARRELAEECGFEAGQVELLGTLLSDTGRNENRIWCYLAKELRTLGAGYVPESGVECLKVPRTELAALITGGKLSHALHLAVLMLAVLRHGAGVLALK